MELREYLGAARRSWLLILGTAAALVALAAVVTGLMTAQYASTSRVFISTISNDPNTAYQGSLFSEQRANSYADLLNSPELAKRVDDALKLKTSPEELSDQIDATVVPETVVLKIDVTDSSAKQAQRINAAVITQLQGFIRELETQPGRKVSLLKATVVGAPNLPDSPASPARVPFLGAALIIGLLLGYGLAVLREILDGPADRTDEATAFEEDFAVEPQEPRERTVTPA